MLTPPSPGSSRAMPVNIPTYLELRCFVFQCFGTTLPKPQCVYFINGVVNLRKHTPVLRGVHIFLCSPCSVALPFPTLTTPLLRELPFRDPIRALVSYEVSEMLKVTFPCSVALTFFCAPHAWWHCHVSHLQPLCGETQNSGHQLAQAGRLAIMLAYNRSIPSGHRNCFPYCSEGMFYCKFPFDGTEEFSTARCCFNVQLLCLSATLTKLQTITKLDVFKSTNRRFTLVASIVKMLPWMPWRRFMFRERAAAALAQLFVRHNEKSTCARKCSIFSRHSKYYLWHGRAGESAPRCFTLVGNLTPPHPHTHHRSAGSGLNTI